MVRVWLPAHLRELAKCFREVEVEVEGTVSVSSILDALETKFPMLRGTIRDHVTKKRRPLVRFFACNEDWSNGSLERELPADIASGKEPFMVVGAIAGG